MKPKGWLILGCVCAVLGGSSVALWKSKQTARAKEQASRAERDDRPISVLVAEVQRRDVPIDLDGIGSVVAYKTVSVKPQVDGRLNAVLFTEGQEVKAGQVLAQIDPRPFQIALRQAQGNLVRDRALAQTGERNLDRYTKLTEQKFTAPADLDTQRSQLAQYQGAVTLDEAQIESAKLNLSYSRITSPIDGVTGVRLVDQGNFVRVGEGVTLVVVTQLDPISVLFTLPQDVLAEVAAQMHDKKKPLVVDAFDRGGETKLATGELLVIDNQINQTTATIRLKAVFPNPERKLWPNQFVKTRLHVSTRKNAVVVPSTCIQRGPQGTYAYVLTPDQKVSLRAVEVELTLNDLSVLHKGLKVGEQVVIEGQNQLRDGARVKARLQSEAERTDAADAGAPGGAAP